MNSTARFEARGLGIEMRTPAGEARQEAGTLQAIARAKQGDAHAVRYLYSRYASAVRLYAGSLLRDADAVDDVVQTTFLKLLTKLDRYEPREVPFEAWLLRVARNAAYDELRRRRTRDSLPMLEHDGAPRDPEAGDVPEALEALPAAWREVLVLRHVVGLSIDEVAERLGTTPKAVAGVQARACERLRTSLRGPVRPPGADAMLRRRERPDGPVVEQLG